jgi:arylsulfatase A
MTQPNIVLIVADDLGFGDLSCYGSDLNHTPRLDRMADEGMRFTDFYVASPVCSPSRAALMTGCYPKRIGLDAGERHAVLLPGDSIGLSTEETTVATILKGAGYDTKCIGKWHLGDQPEFCPQRHGFDEFFGLPYSNDMLPDHPIKEHSFPPLPLMENSEVIETDPNQASLTDRYTAEAVKYIESHAEAKTPFLLYLAHMYVHIPIHTPMLYDSLSKNGRYGAAVAHIDQSTGCILDALQRSGIDENTLVIFTSDNGAAERLGVNAPLKGGKGTTWEGGMREPCIMRWPGRIPAGKVCGELCTAMDFLPTFSRYAGSTPLAVPVIDGHDVSPLIEGETGATTPYEAFFYYGIKDHNLEAVRSGKWKLHLIRGGLYDLAQDPEETTDCSADNPDVVATLNEYADKCRIELGDAHTNSAGCGCRTPGKVDNPVTITSRQLMDPIIAAMYD